MYCPNCGNPRLSRFENNRPLADFHCDGCGEEFELKSQSRKFGPKFANGAFKTKIERMRSDTAPNLLLLHYDRAARIVRNMSVVPKSFFVPSIVEERTPLRPTARRAGWVGSNILLDRIPPSARIPVILDGAVQYRPRVIEHWRRLRFVHERSPAARGWLVDVMRCVEEIGRDDFTLAEVYAFEPQLAALYPGNANVRPKIRQQLQALRDGGFVAFLGDGRYRRL